MGVLPAASAHALPAAYGPLMTSPDSPIVDFYPTEFESDMNGKRFAWQAVTLLPFIDEVRLLRTIASVEPTLTAEEAWRNGTRLETIFMRSSHPLGGAVLELEERCGALTGEERARSEHAINPALSGGINGRMVLLAGPACPAALPSPVAGMPPVTPNRVVGVAYKLPPHHDVPPQLPEGALLPEPIVGPGDIAPPPTLWHEEPQYGGRGNGGGGGGGYQQQHRQVYPGGGGGGYPQQAGVPFYPGGLYGQPAPGPYGAQQHSLSAEAHRLLQHSMAAAAASAGSGLSAHAAPYAPVGSYGGPPGGYPAYGGGGGGAQMAWQQQQQQQMMWQAQMAQQAAYAQQAYAYQAARQQAQPQQPAQGAGNRFGVLGQLPPKPTRDPRAR
jgi:5'-3' exoribonuclease 2